jgi:excisionase family DNA binding protein
MNPIIPNNQDIATAKESSRILALLLNKKSKGVELQLNDSKGSQKIAIPDSASRMLLNILTQMSKGNAVTITPIHSELTTQEAADILKVSRPFLIKQLEEGKMPFKMVGTRRKILFEVLMAYKESMYRARQDTLDKLTSESQDLDLDY